MFIICQYFRHPDPGRAAEFEFCIRDNIRNGHELLLFEEHPAPDDIRKGAKQCIAYPQRLTYANALKWANENLPAGSIVAIVNLDIMIRFTHAAVGAHFREYPYHFLCLSRLEYNAETGQVSVDPGLEKTSYMSCQDAWVFRTPVRELPLSDFSIGNCPGCDNAIAFRAAEAGILPINVAGTFPIWHYDSARAKPQEFRMVGDSATSLVQPEKHGRLFLPRIDVGGALNVPHILAQAKANAMEAVKKSGYSLETDARLSNYLACNCILRFSQSRWDMQYLFACIALNNLYFLENKLKNPV